MTVTADHPATQTPDRTATTGTPERWHMPRVRMETRKLLDTRAPRVLLAVSVLGGALLAVLVPLLTGDPATLAENTTGALSIALYLAPIVAILTVAAEWGKNATGQVTFTLDPRRTAVLGAKAAAGVLLAVALVAVAYLAGALGSLVAGTEFVAVGDWLGDAGWRVLGMSGLLFLAGALAAALQSSVMAIVTFLLVPQLVPQFLSIFEATADLAPYTDISTGLFGMGTGVGPQDWSAFAVAAALWIGVPAAIGLWRGARGNVG